MRLTYDLLINNPIARAELDHLRRVTTIPRPLVRHVWNGLRLGMVGFAIGFFVFLLTQIDQRWETSDTVLQYMTVFAIFALLLHFMTIYRAAVHASNTILREKQAGTWETLLLTDVGARRLVLGKWWAVVCKSWLSFAFLGIIRATAAIGIGVLVFAHEQNVIFWFSERLSNTPVLDACIGGLVIFVFTMLNCLYTAAAGVVGSLLGRMNIPAIATSEAIRIGVLILPISLILIPELYWFSQGVNMLTSWQMTLIWVQITLIDNGTLLAAVAANPLDTMGTSFVPIVLCALLTYGILILVLLRAGQWLAQSQGAASHADG